MQRDFELVFIGVLVGMALLQLVLWLMRCRREKMLQEAVSAIEQPARQKTDAAYQAELASYGLFDYCPKCNAYQGCEGSNECISCGYKHE